MATVAVRGSAVIGTNGTTWATTSNAVDGAVGVNNATYATYTNATASATGYIELGTFGFDSTIGSGDTINSVTVNLRHFENNTGRFASVRFQPYDGATAIGSLFTCTLATSARNDSTTFSPTLAQVRSSTFKIRITITGAASTQSRVESIDYVDVTVDYTALAPAITQAAYRFYADGTETGSTALASQDTSYAADVSGGDVNLQLRVRLQSTNAGAIAATDDWRLQYDKNASGTWSNAVSASLLTEYPVANQDTTVNLGTTTSPAWGESFLGDGNKLASAGFRLDSKIGSPTGNLTAALYAHTGTFGSGGVPTGAALTTSTTSLAVSSQTASSWLYFDFDKTFTLGNGTAYFIAIHTDTTHATNACALAVKGASPTYAGNSAIYDGSNWGSRTDDLIFEVYTASPTAAVVEYASANLTDAAATTNRLGAGTGSFVAGKISEDSLVDNLTWTSNNYTELLYSITIESTAVTNGDALTFRILRNAATTGMTYTVTPTLSITTAGATAAPAVIARSVAVPAVTPQASSSPSPTLIARSVAVPAATGQANALPTPTLIARTVTVDAATPQASSTAATALIARTVAVPPTTTTAGTAATATPAVISGAATIPASTPQASSTATPVVIARDAVISMPTPQAGSSVTPAPTEIVATLDVASATGVSAGTTTPAVIARSAAVPTVTASGTSAATATPTAITRLIIIPAATAYGGEPAADYPIYFGTTPITGAHIGSTPVTFRLGTVEVT